MRYSEIYFIVVSIIASIDWVTLVIGTIIAMIINYHLSETVANRRSSFPVSETVTIAVISAISCREIGFSLSQLRPSYVGGKEAILSIVLGTLLCFSMVLIYNAGVHGNNAEARRQRRQLNAIMRARAIGDIQEVEDFFNNLEESAKKAETGNYILMPDGKLQPSK